MSGKLQKHAQERGSCFTVVTNDPICRENIKQTVPDFRLWAYIDHEPDADDGKPHTHFVFTTNGSRTIQMIADKLDISPQYVQVVRRITAIYRYLVHADDPEKHQYSLADIQTNHRVDFEIALQGGSSVDARQLFLLYTKLSLGIITPEEFIEQNYVEITKMNLYQKIQTFQAIYKVAQCTRTT